MDFRVFTYEGWLWVTNLSNLTAIQRYWCCPVDSLDDRGSHIPSDRHFDKEVIEAIAASNLPLMTHVIRSESQAPSLVDEWTIAWKEVTENFGYYLSLFYIPTTRDRSTRFPTVADACHEECGNDAKDRWNKIREGVPLVLDEDAKKKIIDNANFR